MPRLLHRPHAETAAHAAVGRREQLAAGLSDADVATLRHLAGAGLGANSLRALAADLFYLETWCLAATGTALPWPAPEVLLLKFVAHHLWDPGLRASNAGHGMPEPVLAALTARKVLRTGQTPPAPATVRRKLASWATLTRWRGLAGAFDAPGLKSAVRLAVRATARPRQRKSEKAVTADILAALLSTCNSGSLRDCRDRALLLTAFASGGRRRSELAALRRDQLVEQEPVPADPGAHDGATLPCLLIKLGRTKTADADLGAQVLLIGRPVAALEAWIDRAGIAEGPIFRAIDRWGHLKRRALTAQAVNLILKRGIPLLDAMQQSQHRSLAQAARYYNDSERKLARPHGSSSEKGPDASRRLRLLVKTTGYPAV